MLNYHNQTLENWKAEINKGKVLLIGVDISKKKHDCCFGVKDSVISPHFIFTNTRDGFEFLLAQIKNESMKSNCTNVIIGMEPTSNYWKPLHFYLIKNGYDVVLVETVAVHHNRKTMPKNRGKTDKKDAFAIYDLMRQGKILLSEQISEKYQTGQAMLKTYSKCENEIIRKKLQIRSKLSAIFPEIEVYIKDIFSANGLKLLNLFPTPKSILEKTEDEFLNALSFKRGYSKAKLKEIYSAAKNTIGIKYIINDYYIAFDIKVLTLLLDEKETLAKHCSEIAMQDPRFERILKIKGIGIKTAAGIYLALGDYMKYTKAKQITKLAGLDVIEKTSGTSINGRPIISHKGKKELRLWGYKGTLNVIKYPGKFSDIYNRKLERNQGKGANKRALVATEDCLIRTIWAILKSEGDYDPAKIQSNKKK